MCCTRLAENTGRKKIAILAPSHNFVRLYLQNQGMYRYVLSGIIFKMQLSIGPKSLYLVTPVAFNPPHDAAVPYIISS